MHDKNYSSNSITCDDNGAYTQRQITKTNYFVTRKSNSIEVKAQIVHRNNKGEYFYKKKDCRSYTDEDTPASSIYCCERLSSK